jgi:hypothetical protein
MGKKYHEINARADKKGEKERKDKGKHSQISSMYCIIYIRKKDKPC